MYLSCVVQMMNQLCTKDGDIVVIEYVTLRLAVYSKFQPQTSDFLDIHNPKAVYPHNVVRMYNSKFVWWDMNLSWQIYYPR